MQELLYICLKNPLTHRDFDRMGINELKKTFEVRILDCSNWLMPNSSRVQEKELYEIENVCQISSLSELNKELLGRKKGFAVDYIGVFSIKSVILFNRLKKIGIKLVVIDSGSYPYPQMIFKRNNFFKKIIEVFTSGNFRTHINASFVKLLLRLLPDQRPDYALVTGEFWKKNSRLSSAKYKIPAHSFDYESFRKLEGSPNLQLENYAVYLDEKIVGHEDNVEMGLVDPATREIFFPALNKFFDNFERTTSIKVVIAVYPSGNHVDDSSFGERKSVRGDTAKLIRDAKIVFAHASTSISFAVLWGKPIIFLTSNQIMKSWYQPWIEAPQKSLSALLINIDKEYTPQRVEGWWQMDLSKYTQYELDYIRSINSPKCSLWEIFLDIKLRRLNSP